MRGKDKQYYEWFRSVCLAVAGVLVVCLAMFVFLMVRLQSTVRQTSSDITDYMRNNTDSRFDEMLKMSLQFELSRVNQKLRSLTTPPRETSKEIYLFCEQMSKYCVTSELVSNVFIHYKKMGYVAGNMGFYQARSYASLLDYSVESSPDGDGEAMLALRTSESGRFQSIPGSGDLFFVRDILHGGEAVGVMVMQIDTQVLLAIQEGARQQPEHLISFGLLLDNGTLFATGEPSVIGHLSALGTDGLHAGTVKTGNILADVRESKYAGVRYISSYNQNVMYRSILTAALVCGTGVLFCVVLGLYSSAAISRKGLRPLSDIAQKLADGTLPPKDAYQYINTRLDQLMQEKNESEDELQRRQSMIDSLFLSTILRGNLQSEYAVFSAAKRYDVIFEHPAYQVAVVDFCQEPPEDAADRFTHYFAGYGMDLQAANLDGKCVLLFNIEPSPEDANTGKLIRDALAALFAGQVAACGIGGRYDNLVDIPVSYREARAAVPAVPGPRTHAVQAYSRRLQHEALDAGSPRTMNVFTHQLYAGRYDKAGDVLEALFSEYLYASGLPPAVLVRRQAALRNMMLDTLAALEPGHLGLAACKEGIGTATTAAALRAATEKSLCLLADAREKADEEPGSVPQRAKDFIRQNITDPMLGLYMVSDHLRVSNTYLSTSFKATFGVGVVQYINELRVEQAKELILATGMSIKDIALQVGFSSDNSFIRVFKKLEDKTPTSLRKSAPNS